jgi:hypothetical protein
VTSVTTDPRGRVIVRRSPDRRRCAKLPARYVEAVLNIGIMRTFSVFLTSVLMVGASATLPQNAARSQSTGDAAAYFALIDTPVGALPPLLSSAMLSRAMTSPDIGLRFGHVGLQGGSLNSFDGRLSLPVGSKAQFGINAGYEDLSCDTPGCNGHFIAGANAEGRLARSTIGTGADAAQLTIGLNGEVGFGRGNGTTVASFTGGLPIALVSGTPTFKLAPFVTPAIGWGRVSDSGTSDSGTRFLLGGGVAFQNTTNGVGATVGFQKIFINGGEMMFGLGLTLRLK